MTMNNDWEKMSWCNLSLHKDRNGKELNADTRGSREVCGHHWVVFLIVLFICLVCMLQGGTAVRKY